MARIAEEADVSVATSFAHVPTARRPSSSTTAPNAATARRRVREREAGEPGLAALRRFFANRGRSPANCRPSTSAP
ncbi:hypothetical protein AB0F91_07395 [Amycolatopsis sp. NPDC023774]|uniref:hypothetical protein n=1 Tax=Amycolatopsis sp. NPDC023774 TaxID=3155015 RepID=UPI0033C16FBB